MLIYGQFDAKKHTSMSFESKYKVYSNKMHLQTLYAKFRPLRSGLNVLIWKYIIGNFVHHTFSTDKFA